MNQWNSDDAFDSHTSISWQAVTSMGSLPVVCCLQDLTLRPLCGRHNPVFWLGKFSIFTITALTLTTADRAAVLKRNTEPFWFNAPHVAFTLQEWTVMAQQLPVLAPDQHWRIQVQTRLNYARWLLRSTVTAKANGSRNAFWYSFASGIFFLSMDIW